MAQDDMLFHVTLKERSLRLKGLACCEEILREGGAMLLGRFEKKGIAFVCFRNGGSG